MRLLLFLFMSYASLVCAQQPEITFTIEPGSITIGESSRMKWNIHNADNAYLLNIGKIPLSGSRRISPQHKKTPMTIIAEKNLFVVSKTTIIEVKGGRGEDIYPPKKNFDVQHFYTLSASSYIEILKQFHNVLQDRLEFQIRETYDRHSGKTTFVTKLSRKPKLVQWKKRAIRQRRIAYLIEVNENRSPSKEYPYSISAYIEYQRRSEKRWRPERNEDIHLKSIQKLYDFIRPVFN